LILLAQGRRPRLRKAPICAGKELQLHLVIAGILRQFAKSDWRWCHVPSGELRDKRTAAKLKAMGTQPGWPDFILISPAGLLHCLELKQLDSALSVQQVSFAEWCASCGIPHRVARNVHEALSAFSAWGCLRVEIRA
jgi:hypothetical protein